jgi:succinate dehydrogenase flavin-adding protein (antitoxin of CptAB toxin-antitoxin module)
MVQALAECHGRRTLYRLGGNMTEEDILVAKMLARELESFDSEEELIKFEHILDVEMA